MKTNLLTSVMLLFSFCWSNLVSAQAPGCVVGNATATNIVYKVNGTTYSTLAGKVTPGSTVQVTFTIANGKQASNFSLVSYKAPANYFTEQNATQQVVYSSDSRTLSPGRHTLTVTVPSCYFQIDFVKGCVIQQFGPAGSNNYYGKQNRLISSDNGGSSACPPACSLSANISGPAYICPSSTNFYNYSTPATSGATYNWTVPAGWIIKSGSGTNQISVEATSSAAAGNIGVTVSKNGCTSASDLHAVTISGNCGGNGPCNTSQPRPITGNQHPCPGTLETYCIDNSRGYTSFVWDVPRAHAGNPPTGWVIVSGQGTNCVTVRVGVKSGTMKVKVNDPICGTKVATLPVKPSKGFIVDVDGPDSVCVNVNQTYNATVADSLGRGNGNGNGQVKGNFTYNWTIPAGWVIVSGQGTKTLMVKPGANGGRITVTANFTSNGHGNNGNNGNGVGGYKGYCNTTASDGINVEVNNNCGTPPVCNVIAEIAGPDTVCAFNDDPYTFTTPAQNNATYTWTVPADWTIDSGQGTNSIVVFAGFEPGDVTVTVTNNCGTATDTEYVFVNEDCGNINPLPVELLNFAGAATSEGIALNWSTASEKDNDRFEIQRSTDGRSFENVGSVKGNGNSGNILKYNFLDKNAANGLNYYRLRQVDFDGKSEFSKVISVDSKARKIGSITVYPNPTSDGIFNVRTSEPTNATLQITDMSGRVLHSREVTNATEINVDGHSLGMRPGLYLVQLKAGDQVSVQKLIIK